MLSPRRIRAQIYDLGGAKPSLTVGAGQLNVLTHALRWTHAERGIHAAGAQFGKQVLVNGAYTSQTDSTNSLLEAGALAIGFTVQMGAFSKLATTLR